MFNRISFAFADGGLRVTAVEAAACGCPVIATRESPLPGLFGDGALYVDPSKAEDLYFALVNVLTSEALRRRTRAAGLEAARHLSWEAAAQQMLTVMHQLVAEHSVRIQ